MKIFFIISLVASLSFNVYFFVNQSKTEKKIFHLNSAVNVLSNDVIALCSNKYDPALKNDVRSALISVFEINYLKLAGAVTPSNEQLKEIELFRSKFGYDGFLDDYHSYKAGKILQENNLLEKIGVLLVFDGHPMADPENQDTIHLKELVLKYLKEHKM
ncbi:MAG: hypothetical protein COA79_22295 [Planctomycetota bacterium]|nr:MAG: hypothetical protein COA79_22295 [Planctomycetota bacterium]